MRRAPGDDRRMDTPLDRFRAAVMTDPAIQQHLAGTIDTGIFEQRALDHAATLGIDLTHDALAAAWKPDPLGLASVLSPPPLEPAWPSRGWLPSHVAPEAGFAVDWTHFAGARLDRPFFGDSIRNARVLPFNRLFRHRTAFDSFVSGADADALAPSGFIFHMSRCGSTLAAQMLAATPDHIVASEPAPLDTMLQIPLMVEGVPVETQVAAARAMILAYGRNHAGGARRYFIKTDSWHIFALPLLRLAFPDTPWVFLYRDPVEVLVSQARMPGSQVVAGVVPAQLFGIRPEEAELPGEEYTARVLASTCAAAIAHWDRGGGLMVNYHELPQALFTRILPHFGVTIDADTRALMEAASRRDAKDPNATFKQDSAEKQTEASDAIRTAAATHFAGLYARLEELSASSPR
ncbi:sulfotransferase [Sphingomonas sp. G-3-2-10]|uniref:sulfotransferase family protein n=1 Tax=Sphingomonas sp. G-3-2-10 TaxID=2728838 RepID=UPI00146F6519|nr:sulfotransferase [Sphingomonas sp. G-3-2-10]NML06942.1 sulfotransferase [Sphingomonas sp. G-3-2-10]